MASTAPSPFLEVDAMKPLDLKKIVAKNKKIDIKQLKDVFDALKELHRGGLTDPGYNLARPFSKRAVQDVDSTADEKPRLLRDKK
jgi:hypothetical protein